jgi:hypothetical protein
MSFSESAVAVRFEEDTFLVTLSDGRELRIPLSWFPILSSATPEQRAGFRISRSGRGLHWDELDEDISVDALLRDHSELPARNPSKGAS